MKDVRVMGRPAGASLRWAGAFAAALSVAGCATPPAMRTTSGRHPSELKYGVTSSPRVIPDGEPIPKGGGRDMVGQPYVVAGRTYVPHPGRGYKREGWASWYGTAFHGRLTANGEVFDRASVAAAHPTLPLPSYVRVTNVVNRRSMIVRVNDRGPYEQGRVIDLSERAAEALDFRRRGVARVRVEYVGRASLSGSDDARLLATLRHDGGPASLGERSRDYASLDPKPSADDGQRMTRVEPAGRKRDGVGERPRNGAEPAGRAAALPERERTDLGQERPSRSAAVRDREPPVLSPLVLRPDGSPRIASTRDPEPIDIRPPSRPAFAAAEDARRRR